MKENHTLLIGEEVDPADVIFGLRGVCDAQALLEGGIKDSDREGLDQRLIIAGQVLSQILTHSIMLNTPEELAAMNITAGDAS